MTIARSLIRFCFHHFYHSFAWTYDFVAAAVSVGRWQDWVRATLPHVRGPAILELGFGPGHLQVELNRLGYFSTGLDESGPMIRRAAANLRRAGQPVALTRGIAQYLPFASAGFNSVLATFPTEYIVDTRTMDELMRVLLPGGRAVILPAAGMHRASMLDRFASWLFHITGQSAQVTESLEARYTAVFSQAGFQVQTCRVEIRQSTVLIIIAEKPAE